MATKKDLVEAHSFSRRRLVTAFVSGAPGGREVEPVRPGRVLIGGVALSLLLLAGAAVAGVLVGRPDSSWLEPGSFVTSRDTGEQYVVLDEGGEPVLRRVPNYVSAQLLLGRADLTPVQVHDSDIHEVTLGEDLGIDDAPAGLPEPDGLIQDGWTACTSPGSGIRVSLDPDPDINDRAGDAYLVRSAGVLWLLAPDTADPDSAVHRFELPGNPTTAGIIADRLGFSATRDAPEVGEDWLDLFPQGDALSRGAFGVSRSGEPSVYTSGVETDLSRYRIGDLVTDPDGDSYLLGDDGPQELSDFAREVYDSVGTGEQQLAVDMRANRRPGDYPDVWPEELPSAQLGTEMCAVLHPGTGGAARVTLADEPAGAASPAGLDAGTHDVGVQPTGGAYVLSAAESATTGSGTPYVIDSAGYKYELIGSEVPGHLGYGSTPAPVVPSSWMDFFEVKAQLSTNLARRVPEDTPPDAAADE